jgi:hypothetical protein
VIGTLVSGYCWWRHWRPRQCELFSGARSLTIAACFKIWFSFLSLPKIQLHRCTKMRKGAVPSKLQQKELDTFVKKNHISKTFCDPSQIGSLPTSLGNAGLRYSDSIKPSKHICNYRTPWSTAFLEKLIIVPLLKKFHAFYVIQCFIPVFTRTGRWTLPELVESTQQCHNLLFWDTFWCYPPI